MMKNCYEIDIRKKQVYWKKLQEKNYQLVNKDRFPKERNSKNKSWLYDLILIM